MSITLTVTSGDPRYNELLTKRPLTPYSKRSALSLRDVFGALLKEPLNLHSLQAYAIMEFTKKY